MVELAPWAEAAGLRRGDLMIDVGGIPLAGYDATSEAWSKIIASEKIVIRVQRMGQELLIELPCRDDSVAWRSRTAILRALVDGQWQGCLDGVQSYTTATRMVPSTALRLTLECMRERWKSSGQSVGADYWRTLHAWATKAIEESRYRPTGLSDVRSSLLDAASSLEKAGQSGWASDIRQQISSFEASSKP